MVCFSDLLVTGSSGIRLWGSVYFSFFFFSTLIIFPPVYSPVIYPIYSLMTPVLHGEHRPSHPTDCDRDRGRATGTCHAPTPWELSARRMRQSARKRKRKREQKKKISNCGVPRAPRAHVTGPQGSAPVPVGCRKGKKGRSRTGQENFSPFDTFFTPWALVFSECDLLSRAPVGALCFFSNGRLLGFDGVRVGGKGRRAGVSGRQAAIGDGRWAMFLDA